MEEEKRRGFKLTVWIMFILIFNFFTIMIYFFSGQIAWISTPMQSVYLVACFINVILMIFILQWKKWALFLYLGIGVIITILNLIAKTNTISSAVGIIRPLILFILTRKKQRLFT